MSFQQFDPSQGQPAGFPENGNGSAQGQQQGGMLSQQAQNQQGQEGDVGAFQGQGGLDAGTPGSGDSKTTLWMGELEPWIDENFIRSVWFGMGEQVNVKMIRDKFSGCAGLICSHWTFLTSI